MTLQVARDWVLRLNAEGPDGLIDRKAPRQPSRLKDEYRAALAEPRGTLLLYQAGWPLSGKLAVLDNITIVPLPPKCSELNPQENVWRFIRDNWLSNRVFDNIDALLDHCCDAWNELEAQPWTIMSIGLRDLAYRF